MAVQDHEDLLPPLATRIRASSKGQTGVQDTDGLTPNHGQASVVRRRPRQIDQVPRTSRLPNAVDGNPETRTADLEGQVPGRSLRAGAEAVQEVLPGSGRQT